MNERETITVTVFEQEEYSEASVGPTLQFRCGLGLFIHRLEEIEELIPAEHRDTAEIEIDSIGGYEDSHEATITITYQRPETDAEVLVRRSAEASRARSRQAEEIATLRRLQAKYGAAPCDISDSRAPEPTPSPSNASRQCDSSES